MLFLGARKRKKSESIKYNEKLSNDEKFLQIGREREEEFMASARRIERENQREREGEKRTRFVQELAGSGGYDY